MNINNYFKNKVSIAPLVVLRVVFGLIITIGVIRSWLLGWVEKFYIRPAFQFKLYGLEWVEGFGGAWGIYGLYFLMLLSALGIMLGFFYRISACLFFLLFSYFDLLDITHYLNHHYLVSLIAFLMCWQPAARAYSLDNWRLRRPRLSTIPRYCLLVIQLQLAIVYFYAAVAKLHSDWLLEAQPLQIWLGHIDGLPQFLKQRSVAFFTAWSGFLFDLCIPFLLFWKRSRAIAYFLVILFHLSTVILFNIGIFPFLMIGLTIIFFSGFWHQKIIAIFERIFILTLSKLKYGQHVNSAVSDNAPWQKKIQTTVFVTFILWQLVFPLRHWLYPGNVLWTEEGFRFAWKVMVVEKRGYAQFRVVDATSGKESLVNNLDYLSPKQEVMMAYQADMILQYAHHLAKVYQQQGYTAPQVYVDCFVSVNGRLSMRYIDPSVDLAKEKPSIWHKQWILQQAL